MKKYITIDDKTFWIEDIVLLNTKNVNRKDEVEITLRSSQSVLVKINDIKDFLFNYYGINNELENLMQKKIELENEIIMNSKIKDIFSKKLFLIEDDSFLRVFLKRIIFSKQREAYKYTEEEIEELKKEVTNFKVKINEQVILNFKESIQELRGESK